MAYSRTRYRSFLLEPGKETTSESPSCTETTRTGAGRPERNPGDRRRPEDCEGPSSHRKNHHSTRPIFTPHAQPHNR